MDQQLVSAEERIKRGEEIHINLQECNSSLQERMQQAHERNDNLLEEVTRLTGSLQKNIKEAEVRYLLNMHLCSQFLTQRGHPLNEVMPASPVSCFPLEFSFYHKGTNLQVL